MLDNLPHDQAFSQLIVSQMETYAQKCLGWYKVLVSRAQPAQSGRRLKAPAAWAESADMEDVLSQLFQSDSTMSRELGEKEVGMLLQSVGQEPLDHADMVQDKKSLVSLCLLYTSMRWLATRVAQLRHISERATDSTRAESSSQRHNRRWTLLSSSEPRSEGAPIYLPLSQESAV
jgi:exocyst complex component 4